MKREYTYSFDIFDTVLTRNVLYPKDVFRLVQHLIPGRLPKLSPRLAACFWGERIWSEFTARRKSAGEDITLVEIYRALAIANGLDDAQRDSLMSLELEIESEVLMPVQGSAELLESLRSRGGGVVFVSDMYLSSDFIRGVLVRFGLYKPGDRLYVSGETGRTKGSGNLFRLMLRDLEILPNELVHFGDNPRTDYMVPRSLGINLLHEETEGPTFAALKANLAYLKELVAARLQMFGVRHV
ncbi:MAG: HAD hydrolase-like protein [Deltaproteobacteria bacterium]|nr:HAD hydrolase-like protein [Deltaproteobacteria bacterium]